MNGWHRDYDPCIRRNRAIEELERIGREMRMRMDGLPRAVSREAHERQMGETMDALPEGPERFCGGSLG